MPLPPLQSLVATMAVLPAAAPPPVPLDAATGVILLVCAGGALFAFVTLIARILPDETVPPPYAPRPDPYPHPCVHPGHSTFAPPRALPPSSIGAGHGWRIERAPVTAPTSTPTSAPAPLPTRWSAHWPATWPAMTAPEAPRKRTQLAAWTPLRVDPRVFSLN